MKLLHRYAFLIFLTALLFVSHLVNRTATDSSSPLPTMSKLLFPLNQGHYFIWLSDSNEFPLRNFYAIDTLFFHHPEAQVFILSNSLNSTLFKDYVDYGYSLQVVTIGLEFLLTNTFYFDELSEAWLRRMFSDLSNQYKYVHLTDYIRLLLLYNYGGVYLDFDIITVNRHESGEWIGTDTASSHDLSWTFQGNTYFPNGCFKLNYKNEWIRDLVEGMLRDYDEGCWNCMGPRALTEFVRRKPESFSRVRVLRKEVLYPVSYEEIEKGFKVFKVGESDGSAELLQRIKRESWQLHLYSKISKSMHIDEGSVVDNLIKEFDLGVRDEKKMTSLKDMRFRHMRPLCERCVVRGMLVEKDGIVVAEMNLTMSNASIAVINRYLAGIDFGEKSSGQFDCDEFHTAF